MSHTEIIKKLIGEIKPVGETNTDNERFGNLMSMCDMVERLMTEIKEVADMKDAHQHSMKTAGLAAHIFIQSLREYTA